MNRREFLFAMGATACSSRAAPVEEPEIEIPVPPDAYEHAIICEHPSGRHTNLEVSPLAVHGDVLVQSVDDGLRVWDLTTMRQTAAFRLRHDGFAVLADGTIAAFGEREVEHDCAVYRIASGVVSTYPTWLCGDVPRFLLRTGSTDSVYSVRDNKEVMRFRFDGSKVEADATFEIPVLRISNRGQMFSLDDGRIIAPGNGITIVAPGTAAVHRPMPTSGPWHLARATGERFWYTRAGRDYSGFGTLVLAHLDSPHRDLRAVTFAPSRIVHVASHANAVAVLLVSQDADTWHVAVIDEAGTERWRAAVPPQPGAWTLNHSSVALSDRRLVLATPSGLLLAWDAANGASIAVTSSP